jgi:hypothetical protein
LVAVSLILPASGAGGATFSGGELRSNTVGASGCGTNLAAEPAIHVSRSNNVFLSSERGLGGGTDAWRGLGAMGGSTASACGLQYLGQPNAVAGAGASGGDTDLAIGSAQVAGAYPLYIASLNLGSVAVAHSTDNGGTFRNVPVVGGLPVDDREWIAAYGTSTSLLSFHDIATNNIDILRSDNTGLTYAQVARAIPDSDYKSGDNELGNIAIDHRNTAGTISSPAGQPGFWAYQLFVAPSSAPKPLRGVSYNEGFVSVSNNGGFTWKVKPIPCSVSRGDLDHEFPNVSVGPSGNLWMTWSDDRNVFAAVSADHGNTWSCSGPISTTTAQAVMPWIVATSGGEDLVYYGSPTAPGRKSHQTFYIYFVQDLSNLSNAWGSPQQLFAVHSGSVCEEGFTCSDGRQLFDDFGIDTDQQGWAHIAYSHDAPNLGGSGSYTGYAVQTGGARVGYPN